VENCHQAALPTLDPKRLGIDEGKRDNGHFHLKSEKMSEKEGQSSSRRALALSALSRDLIEMTNENELDLVIGREKEVMQSWQISF
jgi:ATP-dependent Clp protease ATP-binding subunit ClpA